MVKGRMQHAERRTQEKSKVCLIAKSAKKERFKFDV